MYFQNVLLQISVIQMDNGKLIWGKKAFFTLIPIYFFIIEATNNTNFSN